MLVAVLILIIIAISLNYFTGNANLIANNNEIHQIDDGHLSNEVNDMVSNTTFWKRITVVLLVITLPLLWEGRFYEDVYLYNGLLLLTNKLNLVVWLLFITGLSLITTLVPPMYASIKDNFTDSILIETGQNERIVFTLCAILGGIILSSATDFLTILLGLELQSYSVYILAASYRNYEPSEAAGLKYFLLGALSSALVFMGLAILYAYSGSTNLDTAFLMLSSGYELDDITGYFALEYNAILPYAGITLILAGISWKVAAAPLQAWSIDVYDAVPTRTTAILSLLPKIALFSLLIRLISMLTNNINSNITELIGSTGLQIIILVVALSLMIGSIAGLFQPRIKRLLAYSSVLNVGFILMGALLTNSTLDYFNPTLYIIQYIITTAAIWLCLINLANISSTSNIYSEVTLISQLQGIHSSSNNKSMLSNSRLSKISAILAVCLTALMLSTAGIPPMVGFYAKYSVILLALQSGYTSLALIAVLASIISTVYYLGVIRTIWGRAPIASNTIVIGSMQNIQETESESTIFISFFSLIIVLYLLQYSVAYVLISL